MKSEGEINLQFKTSYLASINVAVNDASLLEDQDIFLEQEQRIKVPPDILEENNTLTISGVHINPATQVDGSENSITLLPNSKIKIIENVSDAEGIKALEKLMPDAANFDQEKNPGRSGKDSENVKPSGNGLDLEVTNVSAVVIRSSMEIPHPKNINLDTVIVNFTVNNTGSDAVTKKFYTNIYLFEGNETERVETSRLGSGESFTKTVRFQVAVARIKAKPVIVKVDADNDITELNEDNNIKSTFAVYVD
jgi:hypothetical protein